MLSHLNRLQAVEFRGFYQKGQCRVMTFSSQDSVLSNFWTDWERGDQMDAAEITSAIQRARALEGIDDQGLCQLLKQLEVAQLPVNSVRERLLSIGIGCALASRVRGLQRRAVTRRGTDTDDAWDGYQQAAMELYAKVPDRSDLRGQLLALSLVPPTATRLRAFAECIVSDPPETTRAVDVAFAVLFQMPEAPTDAIFPRLLDGLAHLHVAAAILDLANHWTRSGKVTRHPGFDRRQTLAKLLGEISMRLESLEEQRKTASDADELADRVTQSVQLVIGLCDALALIGEPDVVGKLYQAMELKHRRIRTEAAAALAKLGEATGIDALVALAAEPVARLRVLVYAKELGILDKIPERYQTGDAQAEADIAAWLSEPSQFGIAPSRLELLDSRTQAWPGYDEPRECYLFQFTYALPRGEYSNIAIAGPLTYAFTSDLSDLPPDDIYAAFAGWQATHDEIYSCDAHQIPPPLQPDAFRLERRLRDSEYELVETSSLTLFFGERLLGVRAKLDGQDGSAVVSSDGIVWFPHRGARRPITPEDAVNIVKGRKLMRAFNWSGE